MAKFVPLNEDPRWLPFARRYAGNIYRFAVEVLGVKPSGQQKQILDEVSRPGCRVSVASGHGIGKSFAHSIVILHNLLCFYKSWGLITANDIDQIKASTLKELASQVGRIKNSRFSWMHPHIELMASGDIRVRGYEQNWMCEIKTANAKNANKMAGRHAKHFIIIVDEASTVPDSVMVTLRGALTEKYNKMFLTSQATRTSGFFYDTFHALSRANGGDWVNIVTSSLDSPWVSDEAMKSLWNSYDDDERRIRILGLFPQDSSKLFLGRKEVEAVYKRGRIIKDTDHFGIFVLADIASGEGLRDKSAVSIARVHGYGGMGPDARKVEIIQIPFLTNNIRSNQFASYIADIGAELSNPTYVVDSGGLGINVCQDLEDMGKVVQRVNWGNPCFRNENKDRYLNLRAQATHQMARAVREGRFSILTHDHRNTAIDQMSRIPKTFTDKGRIRVPPKHGPEWEGMGSPDLADTFAFAFLENAAYIVAENSAASGGVTAAQKAQAAADNLLSDIE